MPFTFYHLGPASGLGLIFFKIFDFPVLIISTIILDFEPLYVIIFNLHYPYHRFFHTLFGGSIVAIILALILYFLKDEIQKIMNFFKLNQESSFKKILWTSFFGIYSHIFLDSLIHKDVKPFYPFLKTNPFLNLISNEQLYIFCISLFFIGVLAYFFRLKKTKIK